VIDTAPEAIRTYEPENSFFLIKRLAHYSRELDARVPHGHFAGEPGAADAVVGRTAFAIVRALRKRGEIHAAILLRDLDKAPDRRIGLEQARNEASGWAKFRIVLGCASIMREAWVLVGFEPETEDEARRLADMRSELGFSPTAKAHELTSNNKQAPRSPKRVLHCLTLGDLDRERRCWGVTALETLRERSGNTGLAEFLDEVERELVPLCATE
jgi:hypothetical protein